MKIQKNKSKASIIIVNYNNAKFLTKSITSALNQSYKKKEVIVVDDNSKDCSLEILDRFNDRVKIIKNKRQTQHGSYNQINAYYRGFLKSKGEYLFFLDSDDYYTKDKVKVIMDEFKKKDFEIIFDLPIWKYKEKLIKKIFKQKSFFLSNWPRFTPQSCISVKKKYAKEFFRYVKVNKFETLWFDFRIASYSYLKYSKINIIYKYLTYYRQLENSASKKFKFFSVNWWFRRNQAHNFIVYLEKKFKKKNKFTIDKILTKIINFFI